MNPISALAVLLITAGGFAVLTRVWRQPVIIAYIAAGAFLGLFGLRVLDDPSLSLFADIGVMLLLFLVGLEINIGTLKVVGRHAALIGVGQIIVTGAVGFFLTVLLGFTIIPAIFIATALTFSSTVVAVKFLTEKQDLGSLYGKMSLGLLLIQDIIAMIVLVVLPFVQERLSASIFERFQSTGIGLLVLATALVLGRTLFPKILDILGKSQEVLFLVSIAWVFAMAAAMQRLGLSIEIGGFIAGVSLASSAEHFEIASRIRPVRDFFLALFFIGIGTTLVGANIHGLGWPILVLSLFVIIGNPLIVLLIMGGFGYHRRTGFLTGVTIAQVSEFSLVIAAVGLRHGHITSSVVGLITVVAAISIVISSFVVSHAEQLYQWLHPFLRVFEQRRHRADARPVNRVIRPIALIGAHRTGMNIISALPIASVTVIDFDPIVIEQLKKRGYEAIYGDISDRDVLRSLRVQRSALIISTNPNIEDNLSLMNYLRPNGRRRGKTTIVIRAEDAQDAKRLYDCGADYVILPHYTAGRYIGQSITPSGQLRGWRQARAHDLKQLQTVLPGL